MLLHVGLIIGGIASISIAGIVGLAMKKFVTKKNLVLKADMLKNLMINQKENNV